jgi:uncharacterized protein (UPF0261 family)
MTGPGVTNTSPASTGPASTGPANAGPVGTAPANAGPVGTGPASTASVGTTPVNAGPVGTGPASAGPASTGPASTGPTSTGGPVVAILVTLDTKAPEAAFVAAELRATGAVPVVVDVRLRGLLDPGPADPVAGGAGSMPARIVPPAAIAAAAGQDVSRATALAKTEVMDVVARGARAWLAGAAAAGEIQAVIGLGGGSGTWLAATAMAGLPLGFPKLLVTTVAGRQSADLLEGSDVVVMPSITDIAGLNPILRRVLRRAARAIAAMAAPAEDQPAETQAAETQPAEDQPAAGRAAGTRGPGAPLIGMTMFGVTTVGGMVARQVLADAGYEVAVFHANGTGGATLERLAGAGELAAVLDWTTSELTDELTGGRCAAGPDRLEAAGRAGLPQVVVPGAVDVINLGDPAGLPDRFRGRPSHLHRADSILVRASAAESRAVGELIGAKLRAARGPAEVLVPLGGFSALDAPGGPFRDRAADESFLAGLTQAAGPGVPVQTSEANINDPLFATACARRLLHLMEGR